MMAHRFAGRLVQHILRENKGSIRNAPLPPGSPSWDEFETMIWEEVVEGAQAIRPGFKTVRKLLTDQRFDR